MLKSVNVRGWVIIGAEGRRIEEYRNMERLKLGYRRINWQRLKRGMSIPFNFTNTRYTRR